MNEQEQGPESFESSGEETVFQYRHFNQNDPRFNDLKRIFPDYRGFCWYACLVMAADAVQPDKNQAVVMRELNHAIFKTDRPATMEIFREMRESGENTQTFFREGVLDFLDFRTAGLKRSFHMRHPREFSSFANQLFRRNGVNLELDIKNILIRPDSFQNFIPTLEGIVAQHKVPILPNVVHNREGKIIAGHFVMVGGITENKIIVSDPNEPEPAKISHAAFVRYLDEGIELKNGKRMHYDPRAGIFTLSVR